MKKTAFLLLGLVVALWVTSPSADARIAPMRVVFISGSREYESDKTMPILKKYLEGKYPSIVTVLNAKSKSDLPGLESLDRCDVVVLFTRRLELEGKQLERLKKYCQSGKPLVGIRTASHAFDAKLPDERHDSWSTFDVDVLGANYQGHYGSKPPNNPGTLLSVVSDAATHPVLTGIPANGVRATSHLYKNRNLAPTVTPLLNGQLEGTSTVEPVAWVNNANHRRVFYTSLGSPEDFQLPAFRRLLLNGILWSLNQPIPPP